MLCVVLLFLSADMLLTAYGANCYLLNQAFQCKSSMIDVGTFATGTKVVSKGFFTRNTTVVRVAVTGGGLSDWMKFCCVNNGITNCDLVSTHCSSDKPYFGPQPLLDYGVYIPSSVSEYWIEPLGTCITNGNQQRFFIFEQCMA